MSNELDKLAEAFKREGPVLPREEARRSAISAAMAQFDEENAYLHQGSPSAERLKGQGNTLLNSLKRKLSMTLNNKNLGYILTGSASLAAMAIVVMNTGLIPDLETTRNARLAAPEPASAVASPEEEREQSSSDSAALLQTDVPKGGEPRAVPKQEVQRQDGQTSTKMFQDRVNGSGGNARIAAVPQPKPAPGAAVLKERRSVQKKRRVERMALRSHFVSPMPSAPAPVRERIAPPQYEAQGRDKFAKSDPNPVKVVTEDPVSTFSVDVDTASYAFMRASLNRGVLPQKNAVRVEEMINYFDYAYEGPADKTRPFKANVSIMPTPWNTETKLLRIGIKGYDIPKTERPRSNLVFLLDTSGSMRSANKLPLLRQSFKLLLQSLQAEDTVAIVTYAGSAGTVLEPTKVANKAKILAALDRLHAGGSTAGAEGIRQAYQLAEQNLEKDGVNRVILATDGDFNVGITNPEELKSFVERKRKTGVTLSVLGFGMGNYNDALMQTLAQNGNGNANYIDNLNEARKVLVKEAGSTLFTIAKDVKLQLEFNPARVAEYRLIGYETRILKREDFNNDKVDAGDIGAGHTVTALYEITPAGSRKRLVDDLRYQQPVASAASDDGNEYAFMKIRYKLPKGAKSTLISTPVTTAAEVATAAGANNDSRFAAAVAAFGQLLKGGRHTGKFSYDDVIRLATGSKGIDTYGHRAEFVNLVRQAKSAAALEQQK
ncbi:MAG: VWA domain-containing protein [Pseudomonadota bacterium]